MPVMPALCEDCAQAAGSMPIIRAILVVLSRCCAKSVPWRDRWREVGSGCSWPARSPAAWPRLQVANRCSLLWHLELRPANALLQRIAAGPHFPLSHCNTPLPTHTHTRHPGLRGAPHHLAVSAAVRRNGAARADHHRRAAAGGAAGGRDGRVHGASASVAWDVCGVKLTCAPVRGARLGKGCWRAGRACSRCLTGSVRCWRQVVMCAFP
jgi:hypothetical protein